jgi:predicted phage terminase large subunit-like protein
MKILPLHIVEKLDPISSELSEAEYLHYAYSKGFYDKTFFSDYFLSEWKTHNKTGKFIYTPEFHQEIWEKLDLGINLNIIIARGHGKTTAILIWIIHALLYQIESSILYIASEGLGKKGIGRIKTELESNRAIIKVFGRMRPTNVYKKEGDDGKRWTMSLLQLSNGTVVETKSAGQKIRGDRPTKILFDDPQENKDVENREIVAKFNQWAFTSLYNTLLPGGSMCALGTIIGNLCFVKYLRDEMKWFTVEYQACDQNFENVLWKGMWNKESLIRRRDGGPILDKKGVTIGHEKGIGPTFFNQEFRNIPLNKEDNAIKEYWIRYWAVLPDAFDYTLMAVDPASSEKETKNKDFTGIAIVGVIGNKYYILYCDGVKLSSIDLRKKMLSVYEKFNVDAVIYEKNKEETLGLLMREMGMNVHMHHAHKDKMTRLLKQQSKFEQGNVYFPSDGSSEEVVYQLTNFPDVKHDDQMDSVVYCLSADYNHSNGLVIMN